MSLLFRLFWTIFGGRWRTAVPRLGPCETPMRVWPNDLDILRHMNNGRYCTLMDLGRVDLMVRNGVWAHLNRRGWYPVVVAQTIYFRRSLKLAERFVMRTTVLGWDEKHFIMEQAFCRANDPLDQPVAVGHVKARILQKTGGGVGVAQMLPLIGLAADTESPELPEWLENWSAAHEHAMRSGAAKNPPESEVSQRIHWDYCYKKNKHQCAASVLSPIGRIL
jgi:acyl-CoA thioesterase FadM